MKISIEKQIIKRRFGYHIPKCQCKDANDRGIGGWNVIGISLYAFGYVMYIRWMPRKCKKFCETLKED
ncbi:MAG: hypothetical protein IJ180_00560 [Bacteroidales bacterium]|nr:hypothetical protein [Bacteroidales bacterium]